MTKTDIEAMSHDGASAIHLAAQLGHTSIVRMILELNKGVDINLQSKGRDRAILVTPLHLAVNESRLDLVQYLLSDPQCDPSIKDSNNQVALHDAVRQRHSSKAEMILRRLLSDPRVSVNPEGGFHTLFQLACYSGQLWSVEILMDQEGIQWGEEEEGEGDFQVRLFHPHFFKSSFV